MSKDKITAEELLAVASDVVGVEVKAHHCKGGKGNDRMYVTRKPDGTVIGYCHHCGASGSTQKSLGRRRKRNSKEGGEGSHFVHDLQLPDDFTCIADDWSLPSRAWVRQYGITDDELIANHVGYSRSLGGVVVPIFDDKGALVLYQCRPVDHQFARKAQEKQGVILGPDTSPKYYTRCKEGVRRGDHLFYPRMVRATARAGSKRTATNAVIVEDVLSAIKVSRLAGYIGIPLMGANLSQRVAEQLALRNYNVFIFLDNDNPQVKKNQRKALKLLEPLVPGQTILLRQSKDPKCYTVRELSAILDVKGPPEADEDEEPVQGSF